MINRFNVSVKPKIQRYQNYYDGIQAILNKQYSDETKPCNHTVINYCKNIVDSYCGYLASPGYISYSSDDDIEEVMNILRYNDYQDEDSNLLLDALIYGDARVAGCSLIWDNAAIYGNAKIFDTWVDGKVSIYGDVWIDEKAKISNGAEIRNGNDYLVIKNVGSRHGTTTFFRTNRK